jgi:hypothetical protein
MRMFDPQYKTGHFPLDCCAHGPAVDPWTTSSIDHAFAMDDAFLQANETAVATASHPCVS